jgi:small subunit ribosomal protein S15
MTTSKEKKKQLIEQFKQNKGDTGSAHVQVALLTERIRDLSAHLEMHSKDFHCRRGLLTLVGQRKRLLSYLTKTDPAGYNTIVKELAVRNTVKNNV